MPWRKTLRSALRSAITPAAWRRTRRLRRMVTMAVGESRSGDPGTSTEGRERTAEHGRGHGATPVLSDRDPSRPLSISYAPRDDRDPDPGEVVWAWVPFEEDRSRGKDRPVLVLAEEDARRGGFDGQGQVLVGLMMTSRDRAEPGGVARDQHGATWVDIGSGDWDAQGRPSEVRADRLLRLQPGAVRRDGARLARERFERAAAVVRQVHGWDG